jgi:hypothetical protein
MGIRTISAVEIHKRSESLRWQSGDNRSSQKHRASRLSPEQHTHLILLAVPRRHTDYIIYVQFPDPLARARDSVGCLTVLGKPLPDGRGSVTVALIVRGLLSRDRQGAVSFHQNPKTVKHLETYTSTGRMQAKRRARRGVYDHARVHAILNEGHAR